VVSALSGCTDKPQEISNALQDNGPELYNQPSTEYFSSTIKVFWNTKEQHHHQIPSHTIMKMLGSVIEN
jgi:hypothetical protein